jgi:hypothetical protein
MLAVNFFVGVVLKINLTKAVIIELSKQLEDLMRLALNSRDPRSLRLQG